MAKLTTIQDVIDRLHAKGHNLTLNGHQAQLIVPGIKRVFTIVEDDGPELEIETTLGLGPPRLRYFSLNDPACFGLVHEFLKER